MTLYKLNEDKIVSAQTNGTLPKDEGGSFYPDKVDEATRNGYGYYTFVKPPETENTEYNRLTSSPMVLIGDTYTVTYIYEEIPLDEMKDIRLSDLHTDQANNIRPRVEVPLEDVSTIFVNGSRSDQQDIGDRYALMQEDSIPTLMLKDADDTMQTLGHLDVKRCHKAITVYRNDNIEYVWAKEIEITDCVTLDELKLVVWDI